MRRVYLNRGVSKASELQLSLSKLHSYHSLKGIETAVQLLAEAIENEAHILIVGDFDADGATSTALAMTALARFGAKRVSYLVPDRFRYGYGLTPEIVAVALERKPDLIITVDNGISSVAGVTAAKAAAVKVVITDHHLPGQELPLADAIVNPNQAGCEFPSKMLAGVGVIFYVMAALRSHLREQNRLVDERFSMAELLDLVALGTVADVVPLDYNNRILVQQGLLRIRAGQCRAGIKALVQVAGRDLSRLSSADLGFAVGPRLNAAGRLQDMSEGIECLLETDFSQALTQATELDQINQQRRDIQAQMQDEALEIIEKLQADDSTLPYGLCVYESTWHEGVVGLVASKLKERHHRPAIAFANSGEEGLLKGSARSIPGFHIRDALDLVASKNPGLISKFGGHAMAAGLSLDAQRLSAFSQAFDEVVRDNVDEAQLDAVIEAETELNAEDMTLQAAQALEEGGPWGQGFAEPIFCGQFEVLDQRILKDKHYKLRLRHVKGKGAIEAIAFNAVEPGVKGLPSQLQIAYRLSVNDFRGHRSLQLMVEGMQAFRKSTEL